MLFFSSFCFLARCSAAVRKLLAPLELDSLFRGGRAGVFFAFGLSSSSLSSSESVEREDSREEGREDDEARDDDCLDSSSSSSSMSSGTMKSSSSSSALFRPAYTQSTYLDITANILPLDLDFEGDFWYLVRRFANELSLGASSTSSASSSENTADIRGFFERSDVFLYGIESLRGRSSSESSTTILRFLREVVCQPTHEKGPLYAETLNRLTDFAALL